jgi:hypothetical protein
MLNLRRDWFGYIANISVRTTGQLGFEFVYPADRCCQNVLFYLDDQAAIIGPRMNCWQREYLLRPEDDQILRLTPSFSWSGCHVVASADDRVGDVFVCKGGRSFSVDVGDGGRLTTWQVAVSNCATLNGIELRYRLEVRRYCCYSVDDRTREFIALKTVDAVLLFLLKYAISCLLIHLECAV